MGVDAHYRYEEHRYDNLQPGQVIVIGTDGIWEASDRLGNAYGIRRFRDVIRTHAKFPAEGILDAVYADVREFTRGARQADDITLVVAKVREFPGSPADFEI